MAKLRVGVLCGGRSAEHEVSLRSARNVVAALDKSRYDVSVVGIDRDGAWHLLPENEWLGNTGDPRSVRLLPRPGSHTLVCGDGSAGLVPVGGEGTGDGDGVRFDVIIPVLHGPNGEDGTVQGLLKLAGVPYVGCDVLASAVCMDKDVMKRLLRDDGIPTAEFVVVGARSRKDVTYESVAERLGETLFVKPANLGSSVGVSKVDSADAFGAALDEALRFDKKVIVEEYIQGREIECSVMGNEDPVASEPGELASSHSFYSYDAKYVDAAGATVRIPADLPRDVAEAVKATAVRAYRVLCCEGLARVDFFLGKGRSGKETLYVNELNTFPGFTDSSMYPKMWEASGVSYRELLDRLIGFALDRHRRDRRLEITP